MSKPLILDTPEQIARFALLSLRGRLRLECLGMKSRGASAASILKRQYGYKGSNAAILAKLNADIAATR